MQSFPDYKPAQPEEPHTQDKRSPLVIAKNKTSETYQSQSKTQRSER
jgi:hypothetical protein